MRIQHNIMAMNAYRNLGMNNSKLSKNLEKLSSGYRINRAGDDAAGLAISEKMRAQIAGLDQAQKNAQSGINMVQTAEGALTEVHDMLNRMVTLSTQAANGTYSEPDREKIQAEINALTEEIDRIADNSNFNGTKLLDGSLSTEGATTTAATDIDISKLSRNLTATIEDVDAVKGVYGNKTAVVAIASGANTGDEDGAKISYTFEYTDETGAAQSKTVEFTFKSSGDDDTAGTLVAADGTEYAAATSATGIKDKIEKASIESAVLAELQKDDGIKNNFVVSTASDKFVFTAKTAGTEGAVLTGVKATTVTAGGTVTNIADAATVTTPAADAYQAIDLSQAGCYDGSETGTATLEKTAFEINGEKFVFVAAGEVNDDTLAAMKDAGITHYVEVGTGSTIANTDVAKMVEKIKMATGLDAEAGDTTDNNGVISFAVSGTATNNVHVALKPSTSTSTKATGGMDLQIGASAVETIKVTVDSMKADALGIKGLDIGDEKKANAAIDTINAAIEKVSVQRGNLGAIQNRLEHTINNLGVMEENIQDAESNIRDTDIADEMMNYTKNNILIQSAQAMLAQANQVPQGVLQLMQ